MHKLQESLDYIAHVLSHDSRGSELVDSLRGLIEDPENVFDSRLRIIDTVNKSFDLSQGADFSKAYTDGEKTILDHYFRTLEKLSYFVQVMRESGVSKTDVDYLLAITEDEVDGMRKSDRIYTAYDGVLAPRIMDSVDTSEDSAEEFKLKTYIDAEEILKIVNNMDRTIHEHENDHDRTRHTVVEDMQRNCVDGDKVLLRIVNG